MAWGPLTARLAVVFTAACLVVGPLGRGLERAGIRARDLHALDRADRLLRAAEWLGRDATSRIARAEVARLRGNVTTLDALLDTVPLSPDASSDHHLRLKLLEAYRALQNGELEDSQRLTAEALDLATQAGDPVVEARARLLVADAERKAGNDPRQAREQVARARALAQEVGNRPLEAEALVHAGDLAWWLEPRRRSETPASWRQASAVLRAHPQARILAAVHERLGRAATRRGALVEAQRRLERSRMLRQRIDDLGGLCDTWVALGQLHVARRDIAAALEAYRQSFDLARALGDVSRQSAAERALAEQELRLGWHDRAIARLESLAAQPASRQTQSWVLTHLGHAHAHRGDLAAALEHYRASDDALEDLPYPALRTRNAMMRGQILLSQGELSSAAQALDLAEGHARNNARPTDLTYVRLAQADLAARQNRPGEALTRLEQAADLELSDPAHDRSLFHGPQYAQAFSRIDTLLFGPRAVDGAQRDRAISLLFTLVDRMRSRVTGTPSRDLAAIQRAMAPATALLDYVPLENRLVVIVVRPDAVDVVPLTPNADDLSARIRLLRALLFETQFATGAWLPVARALERDLIAPVRARGYLDAIDRLAIVPARLVRSLPFAALARSNPQGHRYLVEDFALYYPPSASLLATRRSEPGHDDRPAAVFAVSRHASALPDLTAAGQEARRVAALLGVEAHLDADATEAAFRSYVERAKTIHLATHARASEARPGDAYLALVPGAGHDGRVTVGEIATLRLASPLVVLAACQTGAATTTRGDAVAEVARSGLADAFLSAGARSVLASLLPVPDLVTDDLMTAFYRARGHGGEAEALAQAQRGAIASPDATVRHPRAWASFVLLGEPGAASRVPATPAP